MDSERFESCPLRFYVLHFEAKLYGVPFAWSRRGFNLDAFCDLGRNGVQVKTSATRLIGSPCISPVAVGWIGAKHLGVKTLHTFQIFDVIIYLIATFAGYKLAIRTITEKDVKEMKGLKF